MTTRELLAEIQARGIRLVLEDGRLFCEPRKALTDEVLCELRRHKVELLELLKKPIEIIDCPGDECSERISLIDRQGWCPNHKMTVRIVERTM